MAVTPLYTRVDLVDHLKDVLSPGGSIDAVMLRKCKAATEAAYRYLPNIARWSYYHAIGRLLLDDDYSTGTVVFDFTGGSSERLLTLTGGTWPTNAKFGFVRIANVDYEIESRLSSTTLQLSVNSNPGADVASTTYQWMRNTYPLPVDFQSMGFLRDPVNEYHPSFLPPADFVTLRTGGEGAQNPRNFTIVSDQNYIGTMAIRFHPPPDDDYSYEFDYRRRPRQFGQTTYQYNTGTVAASSTTITGTSTTFTSAMVGCVLRVSSSTTAPTGATGTNPFPEQRIITAYTSATSLTIDQAFDGAYSGVAYEISDPIDIEAGAMYDAFLKRAEFELAKLMNREDAKDFAARAREAEVLAMEGDGRSYMPAERGRMRGYVLTDDIMALLE